MVKNNYPGQNKKIVVKSRNQDFGGGPGVPIPSRNVTIRTPDGEIRTGTTRGPTRGGKPFRPEPSKLLKDVRLKREVQDKLKKSFAEQGFTSQEIKVLLEAETKPDLKKQLQRGGQKTPQQKLLELQEARKIREQQRTLGAIEQQREKLVSDIKDFEDRFTKKPLSPSEFSRAEKIQDELEQRSESLNEFIKQTNLDARIIESDLDKGRRQVRENIETQRTARSILEATRQPSDFVSKTSSPESIPKVIDVGVSSKERFEKIDDFGTKFRSQKTGEIVDLKDLEKRQVSFERSASQAKVTPEDFLFFTPGISGRFFGGVTKLAGTALKPVTRSVGLLGKTRIGKAIVSSKPVSKARDFLKPSVTFKRFGDITEKRIIRSGDDFISVGKGTIKSEVKGPIAKLLKRPAKKIDVPVSFRLKVSQPVDVASKFVPRKFPRGSPDSLVDLIPQERLLDLFRTQSRATTQLKSRGGFVSEGIIKVGKPGKKGVFDTRIVKERADVFVKQPRVRTFPIGVKGTGQSLSAKIASVGDDVLSGFKVKAVNLSDDISFLRQKVRTAGGPKFNVKSLVAKGKAKDPLILKKPSSKLLEFEKALAKSQKKIVPGKVSKKFFKDLGKGARSTGKQGAKKPFFQSLQASGSKANVLTKTKVGLKTKSVNLTKQAKFSPGPSISKTAKASLQQSFAESQAKSFAKVGQSFVKSFARTTGPLVSSRVVGDLKVGVSQDVSPKFDVSASLKQSVSVGEVQEAKIVDLNKAKASDFIKTSNKTGVSSATKQASRQAVKQATKQATKTRLSPRTRTTLPTTPGPKTPLPGLPLFVLPNIGIAGFSRKNVKGQTNAYDVRVKQKGKFVTKAKNLPLGKAFKTGLRIVDETAARTFNLKPSGTTNKKDIGKFNVSRKLRRPKRNSNLPRGSFVEKARFAIDSPGEKRAITLKGIKSNKLKSKKRKSLRKKRRK
jgi:hypothetical protein